MVHKPTPASGRKFLMRMGRKASAVLLHKTRIRSRAALLNWLKKRYGHYHTRLRGFCSGNFTNKKREEYELLLTTFQKRFPDVFEPDAFKTTVVHEDVWIACARKYGTLDRLAKAFRTQPRSMPHKYLTIAVVQGVVRMDEIAHFPPRVTRGGKRYGRDPNTPDLFE